MKINKLKNSFRKFKANYISQDHLEEVLENAIESLSSYTVEFDKNRTQLRKFEGDKVEQIQNLLFSAIRHLKAKEYEKVIKKISEGKKIREKMIIAIKTINLYNDAKKLKKEIVRMVDQRWLLNLPTIKIMDKQLEQVALSITKNKYTEANIMLQYVLGCSRDFDFESTNEREVENINERIDSLKEICTDTSSWSLKCPKEQIAIEGKVELTFSYLLEKGYSNLVKKLLNDIEFVIEDRILFRELLTSSTNDFNPKELNEAIKKKSWTGGSNYLLSYKMTLINRKLKEINS